MGYFKERGVESVGSERLLIFQVENIIWHRSACTFCLLHVFDGRNKAFRYLKLNYSVSIFILLQKQGYYKTILILI